MWLDYFKITPKTRKVKLKWTKRGVLFSNPNWFKKGLFHLGSWLSVLAIFYLLYLYYPIGSAYINYYSSKQSEAEVTLPNHFVPTPTLVVPAQPARQGYWIDIPKISAETKVIDNVSPFDAKQYMKVLEDNSVAQAANTAEPGSGNGTSTYIFAHSSGGGLAMIRKNAVFYLLGELKNGDEISLEKNSRIFTYRVYNQLVVKPSQTEYLKYSDPTREVLILQTCWPIGTDWNRLLIFAEKVSD